MDIYFLLNIERMNNMKKRVLALVLVCIVMISTSLSFAHEDDIPKIFLAQSVRHNVSPY